MFQDKLMGYLITFVANILKRLEMQNEQRRTYDKR